jgi:dTDP-4-dehydrorhamnose 3,5-epimerase
MTFTPTGIPGAWLIDLDAIGDERGSFARLFCQRSFVEHGLDARIAQINNAVSARRGTLRGLHYQLPPAAESKTVRVVRGAVFDVVLDLRPRSDTFGRWVGAELSAATRRMMHAPAGCAHGLLTLEDDCEVLYLASAPYAPDLERGVRWDDPRFAIAWPFPPEVLSAKDRSWPPFDEGWHLGDAMREL